MNAKNRYYLGLREYGKRQLYGRAVRTVQVLDSRYRFEDAGLERSTSTKTE